MTQFLHDAVPRSSAGMQLPHDLVARSIRTFFATLDARSLHDRQRAMRFRKRYQREREQFPEYIDVGGES